MRIISKHKDYYDNMRCYSMCSDDFTYIRKTEELELEYRQSFKLIESNRDNAFSKDIDVFVIGFCGKLYQGYKVIIKNDFMPDKYKMFYDFEKAIRFSLNYKYIKRHYKLGISDYGSAFHSKGSNAANKFITKNIIRFKRKVDDQFKRFSNDIMKLNLFEKHKVPVFYLGGYINHSMIRFVLNPLLNDYSFYKVLEGHYAYQELEMYLGNILLQREDPYQITDDLVLAQQKGFDKMSFRKYPTKRRK